MDLLNELAKVAKDMGNAGLVSFASRIEDLVVEAKKKNLWMQEAVNPKEKGELRKKMKKKPGETLSLSELEKEKKRLQEKGKGDKKLSPADREKLQQIIFAINAMKAKKKKAADETSSIEKLASDERTDTLKAIFNS